MVGLALPGTASASTTPSKAALAAGWIYWSTYPDAASRVVTGATLAYPGSPIYAAYYCEEEYHTIGNYFSYELFLYKRF